ncbi:helix-turn-helix domain-containing protein [Shewanella sedimentimangrovi]|uniref:AraC family transcriptional regulator n=1 Tax=Shewanella sedimentimangrovi TaxID=2814293 RepID=A0ABX7R4U6_9GAMM|nr:AraC family transcriptional regulator [Shewanella sedimentimangrovi]QSX38808.1 AraC family transcriptional regulator [Shewanella sedimentimangrovi]
MDKRLLTIFKAPGEDDRIEARLRHSEFATHRHDSYTLALTLSGVQGFNYRGEQRHSLPGQAVILHPDEPHDGKTVADAGFSYRAIAVDPFEMQLCLGGVDLPFISSGLSEHPALVHTLRQVLNDLSQPLHGFERQDAIQSLCHGLFLASGKKAVAEQLDMRAVRLAREYMLDNWQSQITLEALEQESDCDRYKLTRDFKRLLGTSPYRFLQLRRLDKARALMQSGSSLADTAACCGYADQSHFTRQFRHYVGMTPGQWLKAKMPQ